MHWSEPLERVARALLWLTLAAIFVLVPVGILRQREAETALKAEVKKVQDKLAEALKPSEGPSRLKLSDMGLYIHSLSLVPAEGRVYFTNVSARSGVVCLQGTATNSATQQRSQSLAACEPVAPYASVQMKIMFAGGDLFNVCPDKAKCDLSVKDVSDDTAR